MAATLNNLGILAYEQGDYRRARALHEESLALKRAMGDKQGIATSLNNLGNWALTQGDYGTARRLQEESLALKREVGDKQGIATSLNNLGNIALYQADYHAGASAARREPVASQGDRQQAGRRVSAQQPGESRASCG
ncbi:MAG: tetratricopeptide repeat protein [Caldilineaceae bacterium]